jgi:3-hydroxyisobutyrate dehydrogenase-like beta-hydroxyacid dehydrogenase
MFRKQRKSAGVIGLGIIGSQVAGHLRTAGFAVSVWNRTPRSEPNFLGSPEEVAHSADVIQLFVSDAEAVFAVIAAMEPALAPRHTIICSATIGYDATIKAEKLVTESGARFLDAPFTGSKLAAEKGQLLYYVGGDDATTALARPVLEASSKGIVPIGTVGQAAVIKVVTNVLAAVTVETLAEMLAVVNAAGIQPAVLGKALEQHGVRSPLIDMKLATMLGDDFTPHFALKHMLKDAKLGMDLAAKIGLRLPVTTATTAALETGVRTGLAEQDYAVLKKLYP